MKKSEENIKEYEGNMKGYIGRNIFFKYEENIQEYEENKQD